MLATGLAVAGSMLVLGVLLNISRTVYLNALPDTVSQPAARAVYDMLVEFIRLNLRALLVAGARRGHRCLADRSVAVGRRHPHLVLQSARIGARACRS